MTKKTMRTFYLILGCFLIMLLNIVPAYAGGHPINTSPLSVGALPTINSIATSVNIVIVHAHDIALQMASRYTGTAQTQIHLILLIMVPLLGLQIAFGTTNGLSGTYRAIGELFLIWGMISWLLMDYQQLTSLILDGFTSAANTLTNTFQPSGNAPSGSGSTFAPQYQMIGQAGQLMVQIHNLPWTSGSFLTGTMLSSFFDSLIALLFYFCMFLVAFATGAISVIFYVLSSVFIDVAIAVGPVFLPWGLLPWTRKYTANWIHFLIQGGMYRLITPVMMGLISQLVDHTQKSQANLLAINPVTGGVTLNFNAGLVMMVFALLMIYLMLRIPIIVQSLSSGFFSAGLASFSMPKIGK